MTHHDAVFQVEKVIPSLIGGKITNALIDKTKQKYGFMVKMPKKQGGKIYDVWVDADEEGNDCGCLFVEAKP